MRPARCWPSTCGSRPAAHTVRHESDAEVRAYVVFAPGAEMEAFVRAVAAAPADIAALANRHGIEVTNLVV